MLYLSRYADAIALAYANASASACASAHAVAAANANVMTYLGRENEVMHSRATKCL
jgi:hypothetical protein